MKIAVAHEFVMPGRMMLGEVVSHVELSFPPNDLEMVLGNAIVEPIEAHVEGF